MADFATTAADTSTSTDPTAGVVITLVVFFLLALALIIVYLIIANKSKKIKQQSLLQMQAFKVIIPKESDTEEQQQQRRDPKEVIGVMESFFTSLHHFHEYKWWKRAYYGQPTFSFEMVAQEGEVYFYVICPTRYKDQIERQIHAGYPSAHIEPADDYDIFTTEDGGEESAVGALALIRPEIFPFKTYKNLENDPLNALTNSLSKVQKGKAAIQILVQPIDQSWQKGIEEALHNIQQGRPFHSKSNIGGKVLDLAKEVGQTAMANQQEQAKSNEAHNTASGNVRLTALQEQQAKMLVEKSSKVGFKVQIRCVARAETKAEAQNQVQTMLSSFAQFQAPESNGFKQYSVEKKGLQIEYILRSFTKRQPAMILNTEEMTSLFHFPNKKLDTPNIHWLGARRLAPPTNLPKSGLRLGYSKFRGAEIPVYMTYPDRARHFYMIGKTGVGKTNMFENMVVQDLRAGHGLCYMDPNGDAIEWILRHIPKERAEDVILFDPSDVSRPMGLNLLEYDARFPEQKSMVINEMMSIFDKLYDLKQTGGPIFEQYMRNAMLLVMDDPESGSTLMEIPKVLSDPDYRRMKLSRTNNQVVIDFWVKEAEKAGGEAALANVVPYVTSKLTSFTSNDLMRPIIGQQKSAFNFREAMDSRKILLVSLPKGLLGEINSRLLGMIISGKIQISAFSRQNQPEAERIPFYLYVDEFQNFTSKTFATILSEARKYQLSLNITNQYIEQLDEETRNAVIGNVGTILAWRVGASDAEFLKKEFDPLGIDDLVNTEKFNFYIKLLVDGTPSQPFNVTAYPPDPHENAQIGEAIRQLSRLKYGRDRELVEAEIRLRSKSMLF
ncbi:type IV secretion system DNA-binding domain-containing protein [Patescibacteria group bacterium]|nr:type IV secretion system DNA-binding domain-containing protein [Patescibacteria group bacterium]